MGVHHRQYRGDAFYMRKGQPIKVPVNSWVMIDAVYFQEANPNYTRPHINKSGKRDSTDIGGIMFWSGDDLKKQSNQVKSNGTDPAEMKEEDLILCSSIVPGFSYGNKLWAEFSVVNIVDISGLSGVGKTLTAEGISEHLQRPLYAISAGELGTMAEKLEVQLPLIFQRANKWNAVLLLDEADVFLEQCSPHDVHHNAMVSVFLQELKYYQGIIFLTTNRVKEINDAIASRIHLPLKYKSLRSDARRGIWESFLKKAITHGGPPCYNHKELEILARRDLNDRQIKNIISTAHALATRKGIRVTIAHLEVAITAGEDFEGDFKGAGQVDNMGSYV
ncbi:MAG: hypothetical protein M1836_006071 [Candelina mexicana]|nr:MAG: hypothetical protein M1836_006071 [Candelina mexicana]